MARVPNTTEFQIAIDKLGLTQQQAAEVLRCDPRTARRYALGELHAPDDAMLVLLLMGSFDLRIADVEKVRRRMRKKWFKEA